MRLELAHWLATGLAAPLTALLALQACALPPTGLAQAQQTAQAFNMDARFGRNEMVLDQIAPAARDEFTLHHKGWGTDIRIADIELAGMKAHGDKNVDVLVHVGWYRPEQQELKSTIVQQAWRAKTDGWELVSEKRLDGDIGLLGETVVFQEPTIPRRPSQFPTIRLGGETLQQPPE
jgi:hypothetical protein